MSRATNDLNAVRMMIGPSIMYSANTLLTFVVALSMMIAIDPRLAIWSLIPLPFVSISVKLFGTAIHKRFEQIQAQLSEVSAVAQEALSGVRVVRAYRQEGAELERFRVSIDEYLRRNRRLIVLQGFFFPSMGFFLGLGALVVVWLGSREVIAGRITVGQFVAFNAYLTMLSWPMIAFGWVTNMLQRGMASWKRMLEVLEIEPSDRRRGPPKGGHYRNTQRRRSRVGSVRLQPDHPRPHRIPRPGLLLRRHAGAEARLGDDRGRADGGARRRHRLGEVDADLAARAAARSAAGDGVHRRGRRPRDPAGDAPERDRFRSAGTVPVFRLRSRTTSRSGWMRRTGWKGRTGGRGGTAGERDAIPLGGAGRPPSERERILAAAAIARLDKDVADFPKGYETMVGERGITLSGGQKQRTALARAIVIDPRILILDDALSAVDTYTEEEILSRLRGVMRERTSIIVSHRISTVRDADVIFLLDQGRIAERGTHDELIRQNGLYAELHKKQLLEEELAAS